MISEEKILVHQALGDPSQKIRKLVLRGGIAKEAKPGQFVHVQVRSRQIYDPLLRRPISIAKIDQEKGEITLLYRIKGRGTELLSEIPAGECLNVMGPLGKGFSIPQLGELWLVAGGIGSFPLFALAKETLAKGIRVRLFWGGENRAFLESSGLEDWQRLNIPMHITTMDGSIGTKGLVTGELKRVMDKLDRVCASGDVRAGSTVYVAACGPQAMLKAVTEECLDRGLPIEVSLEERMGCAVGACLGCTCTVRDEQGNTKRKKVCLDGPVFRGEEVVWDASY